MKPFIIALLLFSATNIFGQSMEKVLWKGYQIEDSVGEKVRQKYQTFIKIKNSKLYRIEFAELFHMETGESIVKVYLDTFELIPTLNQDSFLLSNNKIELKMVFSGDSEFRILAGNYIIPYRVLSGAKSNLASLDEYKNAIIRSTFSYDNRPEEVLNDASYEFQENGKILIKRKSQGYVDGILITHDDYGSYESPYLIEEFHGYYFLKGITSLTILLQGIRNKNIDIYEADYRFSPKKSTLIKK